MIEVNWHDRQKHDHLKVGGPEVFRRHAPRCGFWLWQSWCGATGGDPDLRGHVRLWCFVILWHYLYTYIYILHIIYILWGNKNPWQFWSQKSVPFSCPELCPRAAFYSKDHCSARKHAHYYGRDRIATLFPDGRARTMQEWAGPRGNAVYYGRDPAKTLIRLWTGPHFNAV